MKSRVLFCPVGMTDPYRDCYEGPSLHINRYYMPHKIYLFYTKEIAEVAKSDGRFKSALMTQIRNLRPDKDPPEILELSYPELEDPSDFDALNIPYMECLDKIIADNPTAEILINISSGTPQMESTACLIGVTRYREKDYRLIQVKNPSKTSGRRQSYQYTYSEEEVQSLLDNEPGADNRCSEPPVAFFEETMRREQFEKFLARYDYFGAAGVVDQYPRAFPEPVRRMTAHMKGRSVFDYINADKALSKEDAERFTFFPVRENSYRKIYEFYLCTYIRYLQEDWHDYLLRLSPLLTSLLELYLQKRYKIPIDSISSRERDAWKLRANMLYKRMPELLGFLNTKSEAKQFKDSYITLNKLLWILEYCINTNNANEADEKTYLLFKDLRLIEEDLRNLVAHQLIVVSEDWAKRNAGKSFTDIQNTLSDLVGRVCGSNFGEGWRSLPQQFNQFILGLIG